MQLDPSAENCTSIFSSPPSTWRPLCVIIKTRVLSGFHLFRFKIKYLFYLPFLL